MSFAREGIPFILIAAALAGDLVLLPALLVGRCGGFFRALAPVDGDPPSDD